MASPQTLRIDKKRRFYFLHGDDDAAIDNARRQIVAAFLSSEERDENYREFNSTGGQIALKKVLDDCVSEMSTVSFLPGVSRVVALYGVSDFFEAGTKRKSPARSKKKVADAPESKSYSEHLASFIKNDLPNLPAVLIIVAPEDYEKWKRVSTANPVYKLAQDSSAVYAFKEDSPQFAFFDSLFARQTEKSIVLWRDWLRRNPSSPKPVYQLASQVRLLIQAKTATSSQLQQRGISRQAYADQFMPSENDKNLFALKPDWRREKLQRAAANFSFQELLNGYEKLLPLMKYAIPSSMDPFVPNRELMAELWIAEFSAAKITTEN